MSETTLRFDLLANDRASAVFDKVGKAAGDTESKFSKVGDGLAKVGKAAAAGLAVGVGAGAVALGKFVADARESEKVTKLTEQIIKSTGGAAKVTAAQVGALSTSISNKTGMDDEAIQSGSNLLLTFKNIRNEAGKGNKIFDQATAAAVDLSAAGFGSIEGASKMLGKALNDPIAGISALGRAGVTFTAQQKEQIKAMADSGDMLGAQKVILGEIQGQVGGAAAATGTAMDKAKVAVGNLGEQVGTALLPMIDRMAALFTGTVVPAVSSFISGVQTGTGVGGQFAAAFGAVGRNLGTIAPVLGTVAAGMVAYKVASLGAAAAAAIQAAGTLGATGATWSLNAALRANPIGLVVTALTALGAGMVIAYKRSETFRNVVDGAFSAVRNVVSAVMPAISSIVQTGMATIARIISVVTSAFRGDWQEAWGGIKEIASSFMGGVRAVVSAGFSTLRGIFSATGDALRSLMADAWSGIRTSVGNGVSSVLEDVRALPGRITSALGSLGSLLYNAGSSLVQGLINGITSKIAALGAKMAELANKVKGFLPGSPVKEGPLTSWNNGAAGKRLVDLLASGMADTRPIDSAMQNLAGRVALHPSVKVSAGVGGYDARSGVITLATPGSRAASGGAVTNNFYITVNDATDPQRVAQAIHTYVKRNGPMRGIGP